jgi:hypothetical protein
MSKKTVFPTVSVPFHAHALLDVTAGSTGHKGKYSKGHVNFSFCSAAVEVAVDEGPLKTASSLTIRINRGEELAAMARMFRIAAEMFDRPNSIPKGCGFDEVVLAMHEDQE